MNNGFVNDVLHGGPQVTQIRKLSDLEEFKRATESMRPSNLWNPMLPPATENSSNDEFNDSSLSTGWTEFDPGNRLTVSEGRSGLLLTKLGVAGGHEIAGLYKTLPAGDFSLSAYCSNLGSGSIINDGTTLCLWENPANLASKLFTFNYSLTSANLITFASYEWTNYTTVASTKYTETEAYIKASGYFMRLRRNGTNYYIEYSTNGIAWYSPNSLAAITISFTPTAMGVACNVPSSATTSYRLFNLFRYLNSDVGIYGILEGNRL